MLITPLLAFACIGAVHSSQTPDTKTSAPKYVSSAWFAGWDADNAAGFPVSNISWHKYNHLAYAVATTTPDVNVLGISTNDEEIIPQFVAAAHANDVTVSIVVGGWTGSRYLSTAVGSAENRTAFVNTLSNVVQKYQFDGIEFDWEYPGTQAIGCNIISPQDTANFLLFLQALRLNKPRLIISAAVPNRPFVDSTGSPSTNVSGFAKELDFVKLMNYDVWGPWTTALGPNSPLNDSCAPAPYQLGSAVRAVAAWKTAGMPSHKIVLAVASYGYAYTVAPTDAFVQNSTTSLAAYPKFDAKNAPAGDAWSGAAGPDACGVEQAAGSTYNFWGLVKGGFLNTNGKPAANITYRFDNCSQTAYVYDQSKQVEISFDDVPSFTAKGKFIKENSLRGFAMWQAGGDYNDLLLDGIRSGAGICS